MNTKPENISSTDVAKHAGVSQATVSRVLSGKGYVADKTRLKIEAIIEELGYRPNPFAQAMRTRNSGTVGVAVSRITNPIVPEILEAISQKFTALGRRVIVWNTDSEGNEAPLAAIRQKAVDGIVFTAANHQKKIVELAFKEGMPVVSFNRYLEGADCDQIVSTNFEGARKIAHYLIDNGRDNIAFINGPKDRTTLVDREEGFRQGLNDLSAKGQFNYYNANSFSDDSFQELTLKLVSDKQRPNAIACGNDLIAFQVLNGLKRAGLSVPHDVWVTGFDGVQMSAWPIVDLTTMRQPLDLMATDAAEALVRRIEGKSQKPKIIQYETEFFPRGSTNNVGQNNRS